MSHPMTVDEAAEEKRADQPEYMDELAELSQELWDAVLAEAIDVYNGDNATIEEPRPIEHTVGDTYERLGEIYTDVSLDFNDMTGDPLTLAERLEKLAALIRKVDRGGPNQPGVHPKINPNDSH